MIRDINFYKKNGYLVKKNLIPLKTINNINKIVKDIVVKEKRKKIKIKNQGGTQSYNNYHFVYNSNSSKKKRNIKIK